VVAAAGPVAPTLGELLASVLATLNAVRREEEHPVLADIPLIPYRRWDFLRRSIAAWNVTAIGLPEQRFLERLIGVYRPYFEDSRLRPPAGTATPAPAWAGYVDPVVRYWLAAAPRPAARRTAVRGRA
jgi:hypothetical protein